jgi:[ribosomal protein S5]-alanine N-acetyltransferase
VPTPAIPPVTLRLVEPADSGRLTELLRADRDFLAPWEPAREDEFFTEPVQARRIAGDRERADAGLVHPLVIELDGSVVGRLTVNDIVRGAFRSAHLGYWVAQAVNGRGVATRAVGLAQRIAFDDLGLHRLQADILVGNAASQRVLERTGFTPIGLAPRYLHIAGRWQDCRLFQCLAHDRDDD